MNINSILNFNRIFYLIRNEVFSNYRKILTIFGALAAILFVIMIFNRFFQSTADIYTGWFGNVLIIGGLIYASSMFSDLHHPQKGIQYIMLPASMEEKLLSKLIMGTIGYTLTVIVFFYLFSLIMSCFSLLISGHVTALFNPLVSNVGWEILNFIVIQSVFMLGSVYFKRSPFFKTILALFVFFFLASICGILIIRLVYHDFFGKFINGGSMNLNIPDITGYINNSFARNIPGIAKILYWFVMAPVFWVVSYFRLKETEV